MKKNNTKFLIAFIFYLLPLSMLAETPGTDAIPSTPYDLRSDSIDILHTTARIDIRNFASHIINAHSTLACKAKINGLHQIKIDITGLTIDSVQTNHIATAFMISGQGLQLALPITFNTNDSFDLDFFYHGTPIHNAGDWGGFYWDANYAYNIGVSFLEDQHSYGRTWLPCLDNFVEKCTYEYFITTDTFRKAFCGGTLIDITHRDSTTTWHWRDSDPVSAYLASITLSDYATIASTYNGIERTIPIQLGARPADTSNLKASFIHLPDALAAFENSYGPYQFDRVGYCLTPFSAGAMEHDCNITFMKALVDGTTNYETTMAHELSHHWFGDLVTCENAGDMWLNEGWASYSEKIFTENLYGKLAYNKAVRLNHDQVLHLAHISDSMYYAVAGIPSQYTYGRTVYDKGADIAHTLRGYMGDTMFFRVLKDYMNDMKYKNINSAQFRDYIKTHCSFNPDAFFDNWVFAPGFPHFSIDQYQTTGTAGSYTTALTIRQKLNHAPAYYTHVPLEIAAFDANFNKQIFTTNIDGLCTQTSINTAFQPVFIALDFNEKISDAITDEYKTIKLNATYDFGTAKLSLDVKHITDSVLVRVEHNWVAPDPMKHKVDGIVLSDYRYWTIDGIFDSTFKANATVLYNGTNNTSTGYYDNSFITNREDSLLIVYRKNASEDWRACDSCRINIQGNVNDKVGKMVIYNVQKGQYALAIHDSRKIDSTIYQKNCDELSILPLKKNETLAMYPNPAKDFFTIESSDINAFMQCIVYNQTGQIVFNKNYTNQNKIIVPCDKWIPSIYLITVKDKSGALLGQSKMVID